MQVKHPLNTGRTPVDLSTNDMPKFIDADGNIIAHNKKIPYSGKKPKAPPKTQEERPDIDRDIISVLETMSILSRETNGDESDMLRVASTCLAVILGEDMNRVAESENRSKAQKLKRQTLSFVSESEYTKIRRGT